MSVRSEGGPPVVNESHVEVNHAGQVAAARITTSSDDRGTAKVAFSSRPGDVPQDARSRLVDQVMEHPDVRDSERVHVVVPLGDAASISRLQEHTTEFDAHAAGASSVIDATVGEAPTER